VYHEESANNKVVKRIPAFGERRAKRLGEGKTQVFELGGGSFLEEKNRSWGGKLGVEDDGVWDSMMSSNSPHGGLKLENRPHHLGKERTKRTHDLLRERDYRGQPISCSNMRKNDRVSSGWTWEGVPKLRERG